jgi:hypothetical protein
MTVMMLLWVVFRSSHTAVDARRRLHLLTPTRVDVLSQALRWMAALTWLLLSAVLIEFMCCASLTARMCE